MLPALPTTTNNSSNSRSAQALLNKAQQQAKSAERALEHERRQNAKREQRRLSHDRKLAKQRDREFLQKQKQSEKMAREKVREEKRTRKLMQRQQRELFAQEQKEAALLRAAELVASNRVPIEITRAGTFRSRGKQKLPTTGKARASANLLPSKGVVVPAVPALAVPKKRQRSAIIVSTASDLDRIVTHSQNLWAKYNAIAKEHNQRVNWITVAKELGIHVKVREKYARMHSRAKQRKFDFVAKGHWKIKDHPEIFQEPTTAEQKARMPPPLPPPMDTATTLAMKAPIAANNNNNKESNSPGTNRRGKVPGGQQQLAPPEELAQGCIKKEEPAVTLPASTIGPTTETNDPLQAQISASAPSTATNPSPGSGAQQHHHLGIPNSVDAAAAAATAAAVVDAAGVGGATIDMHHVVELTTGTAAVEGENGTSEVAESEIQQGGNNIGGGGNGNASDVVAFEL